MRTAGGAVALAVVAALGCAGRAAPVDGEGRSGGRGRSFERVATFPVFENNADPGAETVAEIVDATPDGKTLVYTDARAGRGRLRRHRRPSDPRPGGTRRRGRQPHVGGRDQPLRPRRRRHQPVVRRPSGHLSVIDLRTHAVVATIDARRPARLGEGQPRRSYLAVVMENQRDEEVTSTASRAACRRRPPGLLKIVDLHRRQPSAWTVRAVDLTGLSDYAPDDPEPEFVDINAATWRS